MTDERGSWRELVGPRYGPVATVLGGARGPQLIPVLGGTSRLHLLFGLLFALGLGISGALGT